jgi:hypothetical protein
MVDIVLEKQKSESMAGAGAPEDPLFSGDPQYWVLDGAEED